MIFSWKSRKTGRAKCKNKLSERDSSMELVIPHHFHCPISFDLMKDPVTLSTGITYDRESIERWFDAGNRTCPVTNRVLRDLILIPNHSLRKMIQDWCVDNKSHGIERIPTPRIPVTPLEVSEICYKIQSETQIGDEKKCMVLLCKMKALAKESERNKRCVVENGGGRVLSASFESFSKASMQKHEELLKEILSGLTWMFPIGEEGRSKLGSTESLRCMGWFLKGDDLSARQNAVTVLKELLCLDQSFANNLTEIKGLEEAIFNIVKVPICPKPAKAALMVIYHMMTSSANSQMIVTRFVDMGLVSLLIEILADGERVLCEQVLAVLDCICNSCEGREKAYNNALTIPALVKKILRVSTMATELSVSILWKLCKGENGEDSAIEALQVGAFKKILVVLQMGCGERTKEKVTELLKLMNLYKDRVDCFDSSSGFKYLKRSY